MILKHIIIIPILLGFNISAQTFSEMAGERVFVNKKIISYTYTKFSVKNGIKTSKSNIPSMSNPYFIYISSNENSTSIRINNKNMRDDIFRNFTILYKMRNDEKSWIYEFSGNPNCAANIIVYDNSEEHQDLYLKCKNWNNSETLMFTISKNYQL